MKVIEVIGDEPVSLEEARAHLEAAPYEDSDIDPMDDTMIEARVTAAREACEAFLGLSLVTKILEIALDTFPSDGAAIDLPGGPVREVYTVSWGTESDEEMAAADYVLDDYRKPNQLKPLTTWPSVTESSPNVLKVRYLAGYGVDSDGGTALPKVIRQGILLELTNFQENRGDQELSMHAQHLLRPHRVRLGMA